jgi:ribosome maturation factor RimP
MTERNMDGLEAAVLALAQPIAQPLGAEVLAVEVKGQKGRRLVRVTADSIALDADAGLDIDTIATFSRKLAKALDEADPIDGGYNLEVTSPGADRPLTSPRDFARNLGREVRLVEHDADAEAPARTGIVTGVTETELTLEIDGVEHAVPFADVDHGLVVLPW